MGLFSEVVNRCPALGDEFLGVLQTKDLTSLLDTFWLAPDGSLFEVQLPLVDENGPKWRGKVRPYRKSGVLRFTTAYGGNRECLEALAYFKCGMLNAVLCKGPIFSCDRLDH